MCIDEKHDIITKYKHSCLYATWNMLTFVFVLFLKDDSNEYDDDGIHIERITKNLDFWEKCVESACHFFTMCLLPEILGNWYTRLHFEKLSINCLTDDTTPASSGSGVGTAGDNTPSVVEKHQTFCYCRGPDEGNMVACDNPECTIEWFHITCLQMERLPKGKSKWYCPDCRILPQFQVRRRKKGLRQ